MITSLKYWSWFIECPFAWLLDVSGLGKVLAGVPFLCWSPTTCVDRRWWLLVFVGDDHNDRHRAKWSVAGYPAPRTRWRASII
ncbi:MAG: hypothetical protein EB010_00080 [Acidimicrobiia bacterium]|nr:hypothetical protein [Actinomycetota bacterium]NDD96736.1 hypothetical protein [Actinomycetota bacterium]NDE57803.1 hypothetical protein [Acidimicrobiia bacterium]NDE79373.1 hypothetical protein [Actinomycetota bacterium]NDF30667.1 hypothetical protein [Acidimicrobiia bacterium]